ncbi:hypothetical protein ACS0TY_007674 [Phlomoides rotata]
MRVTPRDANYTGPGSRFCILRPELISGFAHMSNTQEAGSGGPVGFGGSETETTQINDSQPSMKRKPMKGGSKVWELDVSVFY